MDEIAIQIADLTPQLHPGSALVWTDFMIRHGQLEPDGSPAYLDLAKLLRGQSHPAMPAGYPPKPWPR